jgi:hypothetical protein
MITHGENFVYLNLGSPLHYKQEIYITTRCLETAFYILIINLNNMAAAKSLSVASSDQYNQNKCDLSVSECSNYVLMEKQLHSAMEKLKSAKLIIKLLQKERDEDFPHDDRTSEAINSPGGTSATVYSDRLENNKWK